MKSYSKQQVQKLLKENNLKWADFIKWMRGQTCPILDDGECGFYQYDVDRYVGHKKDGHTPIIWD
jgi:hypothetical protein